MIIQALPLLLMPLSTQISNLGGEGYNCSVKSSQVPGSYSYRYEFNTHEGLKTLVTLNEFQVGFIDDASGDFHVYYYPDRFEYNLVRVVEAPKMPGGKILVSSTLGATFPAAMAALKELFPNRVNWSRIQPPPTIYS